MADDTGLRDLPADNVLLVAVQQRVFGANSWLVEEMYEQYVEDPASVSERWRNR